MKCADVQLNLPLFLYGELSCDEEEAMESHLESCAVCKAEEAALSGMHRALNDYELTPSFELLSQCRRDLRSSIEAGAVCAEPWWRRWISPGVFWKPAGALALVAIGFVGARLTMPDTVQAPARTTVRAVKTSPDGQVRIVVDETRQRVLSGRPEDESIKRLLLAAAKDPSSSSVRANSVEVLTRRAQRQDVRNALLRSLREDTNEDVRITALEGLHPYASEPEVRAALSRVLLSDTNVAIRSRAFDLLVHAEPHETELVGLLQELIQREEDSTIRERSQSALRAMNASLGTF